MVYRQIWKKCFCKLKNILFLIDPKDTIPEGQKQENIESTNNILSMLVPLLQGGAGAMSLS